MAKRRNAGLREEDSPTPVAVEALVQKSLPLRLAGIDLRSLECHVDTDGGKPQSERLNLKTEAMFQVDDDHQRFRVVFSFSATLPEERSDKSAMPFLIRATYHVRYDVTAAKDGHSDAEWPLIYTATQKSALINVWPFWRELVASMTNRMNLPRLILPLLDMGAVARGTPALLDGPQTDRVIPATSSRTNSTRKPKGK